MPEFLIEHFDLAKRKEKEVLHFYFEESDTPTSRNEEVTNHDFRLRGNIVYLHIQRRTWMVKNYRNCQKVIEPTSTGAGMTPESGTF